MKASKVGMVFMMGQAVYLLAFALLWAFQTDVWAVSDYAGYTGQTLADALASHSKPAELWLATKGFFGFELIPISLLMMAVTTLPAYPYLPVWLRFVRP